MMSSIELNMKLQDNLKKYIEDFDAEKVYACSILMGVDPEEQLYEMYKKHGWTEVSPEK